MKLKLPQNSWFGDAPVHIDLPDEWQVQFCGIQADECLPLGVEELRKRFSQPIGSKTIRDLAKAKTEVAIIFDDISRSTPVQPLAEIVLEELSEVGVRKEAIRFICALGTHGAHTMLDFEKKLGREIVRNYPVFNHNPYENCTLIGKTSRGTNVSINSEVMKCDLKIGIGSIVPHPYNGFGGGGKIILPGVASIETIYGNHETAILGLAKAGLNPATGLGHFEGNEMRLEIEEVTRMAGLDIKIDALVNSRREIVDLYVGDPIAEHHAGVARAAQLYTSSKPEGMDVVIANANAKANEAVLSMYFAALALKDSGGTIVIIDHTPMGQVVHYLVGAFGLYTGGSMWTGTKSLLPKIQNVIFYTPYPDYSSAMMFGPADQIKWAVTWEEAKEQLKEFGAGTKAAVLVDGTIQYFSKT